MVEDDPIVLPKQHKDVRKDNPIAKRLGPAPPPQTPKTHPLSGLKVLGHVRAPKSHPAVPTLREAETGGNTSDVDLNQPLLCDLAADDSLPNATLPDIPVGNVTLAYACPDGPVRNK